MTEVKHQQADRYIKAPPPGVFLFLVFGPDSGLVSERIAALIAVYKKAAGADCETIRLEGDAIAQDPLLLADEANAIGMFSSKRILRIRAGARSFTGALDSIFAAPPRDCIIIIEAGALRRDAPLRALCGKESGSAAIECYADSSKDVGALIDTEVTSGRLPLNRNARDLLAHLLGADRLGTRSELEKLALYAHGQSSIGEDDIRAIIINASALAIDDAIDAAFSADEKSAHEAAARLFETGTAADVLVGAAARQATLLHRIILEAGDGRNTQAAIERAIPRGLHFARRDALLKQLKHWTAEKLLRLFPTLKEASFRIRIDQRLASLQCNRLLLAIASLAKQDSAINRG